MRNLLFLLLIGLVVYSVIDVTRSDEHERAGLPSALWILVVLVPVLGPIVWLVVSRSERARVNAGGAQGHASRGSAPEGRRGPVAPDDDPDFLWRLGQQQRRRDRDATPRPTTPGAPTGPTGQPTPESPAPRADDADHPDDAAPG